MANGAYAYTKGKWALDVQTHSREQLINLSSAIAHGLHHGFVQNPNDIPYIMIVGDLDSGKSMIVEAMMKTLLDGQTPNDMKHANAKRDLFIEPEPLAALDQYCQAIGHTGGTAVMYGFDRVTSDRAEEIQERRIASFKKAAAQQCVPPVGAIFSTIFMPEEDIQKTKPWILIEVSGEGRSWERTLTIRALNHSLRATTQFQHYWGHITDFSRTGVLSQSALTPYVAPTSARQDLPKIKEATPNQPQLLELRMN